MRYMINMDYSADLPINTMGRRIRTRLYFTSESHLHTLLNVIRFSPSADKRLLSDKGADLIAASPELCYLTQVVIRLFENTLKDVNDPKRFRIEILFSPGATATPSHMSALQRDLDSSRFDTEALQIVSKDNLTCNEVEDYFSKVIEDGKTNDDDDTMPVKPRLSSKVKREMDAKKNLSKSIEDCKTNDDSDTMPKALNIKQRLTKTSTLDAEQTHSANNDCANEKVTKEAKRDIGEKPKISDDGVSQIQTEHRNSQKKKSAMIKKEFPKTEAKLRVTIAEEKNTEIGVEGKDESKYTNNLSSGTGRRGDEDDANTLETDEERIERMARILAKQYLWTSAAVLSFVLGVACLFLSNPNRDKQNGFNTRRWTRR